MKEEDVGTKGLRPMNGRDGFAETRDVPLQLRGEGCKKFVAR